MQNNFFCQDRHNKHIHSKKNIQIFFLLLVVFGVTMKLRDETKDNDFMQQ